LVLDGNVTVFIKFTFFTGWILAAVCMSEGKRSFIFSSMDGFLPDRVKTDTNTAKTAIRKTGE